jgi:hypothetical protein
MGKPPFWLTPNAEFHMYVGWCITAWGKVEDQLFSICEKSLGLKKQQASIIYYRTPNIKTRLELVDELILSLLPNPMRKSGGHPNKDVLAWRDLVTETRALMEVRNRIAHSTVRVLHDVIRRDFDPTNPAGLTGEFPNTKPSFEIFLSATERLRGKSGNITPLRVDDLSLHRQKVQKLTERLNHFAETVLPPHLK